MAQMRSVGRGRPQAGGPSSLAAGARRPAAVRVIPCTEGEDLSDRLGAVTDREDLERLFTRSVAMPQILQLMGRHVSREQISELLQSATLEEDLKKLLG